ncbi:hypothetical protein Tco_1256759 [Tanacetum coccineum]
MVNVIPPDHVDDVPVVKPNQHDDVPVVPEPVLVDEDEDPEEDVDDWEVDRYENANLGSLSCIGEMFLKYSTGLIPPKKSRGKGSQGKKTADVSQESVDVSDEFEPKPAKKNTRKLAEDIQVLEAQLKKLVGYQGFPMSPQSSCSPSSLFFERTILATSSEGTGTKPGVLDEEKVTSEANVILEWGSENESEHSEDSQLNSDEEEKKDNDGDADDEDEDDDHISDIQDTDDEDAKTCDIFCEKIEIYTYKIFKCIKM